MSAFKKLIDKLEKYSMEYMNDYIYAATTQLYYNRTKDLVEKIDKESWNGMEDDDERYEESQQVAEELLDFWLPGITRINFEQGTFSNDLDLEFHDAVRTFYAEKYQIIMSNEEFTSLCPIHSTKRYTRQLKDCLAILDKPLVLSEEDVLNGRGSASNVAIPKFATTAKAKDNEIDKILSHAVGCLESVIEKRRSSHALKCALEKRKEERSERLRRKATRARIKQEYRESSRKLNEKTYSPGSTNLTRKSLSAIDKTLATSARQKRARSSAFSKNRKLASNLSTPVPVEEPAEEHDDC